MTFKPMLAATIKDTSQLSFPLLASNKLDGIRCVILDGKALTRNLKPIPNKHIREFLESYPQIDGFDGEIMLRKGDFNNVQSAVMSEDGEPNFYYAVFDYHNLGNKPYIERLKRLSAVIKRLDNPRIEEVGQFRMMKESDVLDLEQEVLADGYEGLILRSEEGSYKYGRSTLNERKLMKLKRFDDDEAEIIGMEPLYENQNAPTTNALGRTERSSHQANMVAQPMMGAMQMRLKNGKEFSIGTGFDDDTKKDFWRRKKQLIGKWVKFKFQELTADGIPRFPVFLGLRDPGT